jgi:hypothetical protein
MEHTAAGLYRILTCFPFHCSSVQTASFTGKDKKNIENEGCVTHFYARKRDFFHLVLAHAIGSNSGRSKDAKRG